MNKWLKFQPTTQCPSDYHSDWPAKLISKTWGQGKPNMDFFPSTAIFFLHNQHASG